MVTRISHWLDRDSQASGLASLVASQLRSALMMRNKARLAVPGGTTPAPFLRKLAQQALVWSDVTISLTDERQVPADHERSNALLLKENFLNAVNGTHFLPLFEPNRSLTAMSQQLKTELLPLDVCVLGMGTDGHFASLFPKAKQLAAGLDPEQPEPLLIMEADNVPEPRLSLSLSALLSAPALHLLITGEEKLTVWQQASERVKQGELSLPIDYLLARAGDKLITQYAP